MTTEPTARVELVVDQEKAARHGVSAEEVVGTLALCADEQSVTAVRREGERRPLPVVLQLDRAVRSHPDGLATVPVRFAPDGAALELGSLTREREGVLPRSITRKDGRRVVYVTADAVGISPADAVFAIQGSLRDDPLPAGYETELGGEGEWKITLDVFRDLGIAFAAALVGIYVVLVGQTRSLLLPVVMMVAITPIIVKVATLQ